jgi:hypothetical protein
MRSQTSKGYGAVLGTALIAVGALIAVVSIIVTALDFSFEALGGFILGMILFFAGVAVAWLDRGASPE